MTHKRRTFIMKILAVIMILMMVLPLVGSFRF